MTLSHDPSGEPFGVVSVDACRRAVDALVDAHGYLIHEERDAALVVMERAFELLGVDPVTHHEGAADAA